MDKEEIFEEVKNSLIEELGVDNDDVKIDASFYDDLGIESIDLLKLFFSLETKLSIRITIKEVQSLLQGNLSEDEFFDENGLVTKAALEHIQKIFPEYNLEELAGELDQLKLFSLFTVRHLVNIIAEKASS
ncbi:acyl carrier protein [Chloroflexota bacterium]